MYFRRSDSRKFSNEMLAKFGFTEDVARFYQNDPVKYLIASAYLELKTKVDKLVERLPDNHKNAIDVDGLEELFTKDVKYDFEKSFALYLRCSESRKEVDEEFIRLNKRELRDSDKKFLRDLERCAKRVEEDIVSWYTWVADIHCRRYYFGGDDDDDDDDDDSNEVEIYD